MRDLQDAHWGAAGGPFIARLRMIKRRKSSMSPHQDEEMPAAAGDEGRATEARIVALLVARDVHFRVHAHPVAATVAEAVVSLPFPFEQFLKTLAFLAGSDTWILAALRGCDRLDYRKLAAAAGVRRADLRQPSPGEIAVGLGMAVGGVTPFPPPGGALVIVDRDTLSMQTVYCGIGPNDRTLEIGLRDLVATAQARVEAIAQSTERAR
jgi:prolyl-tRNA editing enzyme YbaK/EbsC (Cys-tRNA(Pro) deacylase)